MANIVSRPELTYSRTNHKSLITALAVFKFDLWPQTVYSSGGERYRSQTPTESTSARRKVITLPVVLICNQQHASKAMAEQIIMWTVICVRSVVVWFTALHSSTRRKGKTCIGAMWLFRSCCIISTQTKKQNNLIRSHPLSPETTALSCGPHI